MRPRGSADFSGVSRLDNAVSDRPRVWSTRRRVDVSQPAAGRTKVRARVIAAGGQPSAVPVDSAFPVEPSSHPAGKLKGAAPRAETGACASERTEKLAKLAAERPTGESKSPVETRVVVVEYYLSIYLQYGRRICRTARAVHSRVVTRRTCLSQPPFEVPLENHSH